MTNKRETERMRRAIQRNKENREREREKFREELTDHREQME